MKRKEHTKAIVTPSQYAQKDGVISIHYITCLEDLIYLLGMCALSVLLLLFFRTQFFFTQLVEVIADRQHTCLRFG